LCKPFGGGGWRQVKSARGSRKIAVAGNKYKELQFGSEIGFHSE
jgi:hypothetical protein